MTVIAYDGKTMAADKRTSFASSITTTTKIHRVNGALIGCAGISVNCAGMIEWFLGGRVKEDFPAFQKTNDTSVDVLCIEPDGTIHVYQTSTSPIRIEERFMAFGSGSNYALAVMYLGHDARKAVEVASALDHSCGNGIDALELAE